MNIRRSPRTPYIKNVRAFTAEDIETLRLGSKWNRLQKITEAHHKIARLIVSGLSDVEVAHETGYSTVRISSLKSAPAMKELIEKYRADENEAWKLSRDETYAAMHRIRSKALAQLEAALNNPEEPLPAPVVLRVFDSVADRTDFHRKTSTENVNINFAARLESAIRRSKEVQEIEA